MDDYGGNLSQETLDLCSSFDSATGYELSPKKPFPTPRFTPRNGDITLNSSEHSAYNNSNYSCSVDLNQSGFNTFPSLTKQFEGLSLDYDQFPPPHKVKAFKQAVTEVNDDYEQWMVSSFLISSFKSSEHLIPFQLRDKVRSVISAAAAQPYARIKDRRGKTLNILGLEDEDIEALASESLSSFEICELNKHVMSVVRSNVKSLRESRNKLKGLLGKHTQKVVPAEGLFCEERERQAVLYDCVRQQLDHASQLLVSSNQAMQQSSHIMQDANLELQRTNFRCLCDKTKFLYTSTSILKHKVDQNVHKDKSTTRSINRLGDKLKSSVAELREQLKSQQKALGEYERKEKISNKFRDIVVEFAKTKRQLYHKQQTLDVLNEPDVSFS